MSRPLISAVIMARNEEKNIEDALRTLSFADQIVVADTGSSDNTLDLSRRAGAEVHSIQFDGYGASKNRALDFCKHEWIFFMDADERVSPELARSIMSNIENSRGMDGFRVCRLTYFLGKPIKHSGWYPEHVLRLFRKGRGRFSSHLVHETAEVDGKTGRLSGLLYHRSYDNLEIYLEKMNAYSTLGAEELHKAGKRYHLRDLLLHPPATFLKMYIIRAGFLDGFQGLLLALLSSFHVLVKYAKLRGLCRKGNES